MPHVKVSLRAGRDDDTKRKVALAITEALVKHAGATTESCSIVFQDVAPTDWFSGGKTLAEKSAAAAKPAKEGKEGKGRKAKKPKG